MNLDEFDKLTDEAFGYLQSDFGYSTTPSTRGGLFSSAFAKNFVKDDLTICFVFGDADSQDLCGVFFDDGIDAKVQQRHYRIRCLHTLLNERMPDHEHLTKRDLTHENAARDAIFEYAALLRDLAVDVIEGDFSAFPALVYVLCHVDRKFPTGEVRRLIGVYSSYELVETAITHRRDEPGFIDRQDGFEIWRLELDGNGCWYAGIPLDSDRVT